MSLHTPALPRLVAAGALAMLPLIAGCSDRAPAPPGSSAPGSSAAGSSTASDPASAPAEVTLHADLSAEQTQSLVHHGGQLFLNLNCNACHTVEPNGTRLIGPPLNGIMGRTVPLADGQTTPCDLDYVYRSIVKPGDQVVRDFQALMPDYPKLPESDRVALAFYVRSLSEDTTSPGDEKPAEP